MKFLKGRCRVLQLGLHILVQATSCLESRFVEKYQDILVDKLNRSQQCTFTTVKTNSTWGALGKALPAGCRSWPFPSIQPLWEHVWSDKSLLDLPGKAYKLEKVQLWSCWRDRNMYFMRKCWEIWGSSAWIREDSVWTWTENSWKAKARTFPLLKG